MQLCALPTVLWVWSCIIIYIIDTKECIFGIAYLHRLYTSSLATCKPKTFLGLKEPETGKSTVISPRSVFPYVFNWVKTKNISNLTSINDIWYQTIAMSRAAVEQKHIFQYIWTGQSYGAGQRTNVFIHIMFKEVIKCYCNHRIYALQL